MAQSNPATVARPYAKAAFETAVAQGDLSNWSKMLELLAWVVLDPRVESVIEDPRHAPGRTAEIIVELCGDQLDARGANFVALLAENGRLAALAEIFEQFEAARAEHERRVEVEIISAFALSDVQQGKLADALKKRLDREISITTSVDGSLIGGVIIHAGDTVIDGSLRGRLAQLESSLNA